MRSRLKAQNPAKYVDRGSLDKDLMILRRALQTKVPLDGGYDWKLPSIIEEYKRGNVMPLHPQRVCQMTFCDLL